MYSVMRARGSVQGMPNRSAMFCLIWVPSPSSNRPPDRIARSHAV
ncbi:Uncharacterised protein [Mycobacterium tuberculosis]|nr:Uncharacterised protein [Mycobacterium tuberculosis]